HGKVQIKEVARRLGTGPRTLTRRLASEGLTFRGVLDALRSDLAKRHLADHDLSIQKSLGYSVIAMSAPLVNAGLDKRRERPVNISNERACRREKQIKAQSIQP